MRRTLLLVTLATGALSACASSPLVFPVEATRYHNDPIATRGTISVAPDASGGPASLADDAFVAAVRDELQRSGFTPVASGPAQFSATVFVGRTTRALPPRRSPIQIGIGGGSYSGGYHGGGGVGGGVSFPVGGGGAREGYETRLQVRISRGAPGAIWEGSAQSLTDSSAPDAGGGAIAARLAHALFTGFPGESGRTIQVR